MMTRNRKNAVGRVFALLLSVVLVLGLCCPVLAQETAGEQTAVISDTYMTITIPKDAVYVSQDTHSTDPSWAKIGVLDVYNKQKELMDNGVYAEIHADDGQCIIAVRIKENSFSEQMFNINILSESQRAEMLQHLTPTSMTNLTGGTASWYEHPQIPFFCIDIHSDAVEGEFAGGLVDPESAPDAEGTTVYERLYGTLYNGRLVSFDCYTGTEQVPEAYDALLRQIVDSAEISYFEELPIVALTPQLIGGLILVLVLIIMIVAFFVHRSMLNRRLKRERRELADQLSAYRNSKVGREDEGEGELRFVNETEHSDAAIRHFANYQGYLRGWPTPLFTLLLGCGAVYMILSNDSSDTWWVALVIALAVVYTVYRYLSGPTMITKAQIRVFSKLRSRKAGYYFYDGDFRITGLQASNLHPYFQITKMYETEKYFYMYFGEENTYYIHKDGFTKGDVEGFRAFMREKLGKNYKGK